MRSCLPALFVALRFRHCGGPVRRGSGKRYQRATAEAGVKYGGMVLIIGAGEVLFVCCLLFGDGKALFVLVLQINPPPGSCASTTMLSLDTAWRIFKLFVVVGVPAKALLVLVRLVVRGQRRRRCPSSIRSRTPSACRDVSAGDDEGGFDYQSLEMG